MDMSACSQLVTGCGDGRNNKCWGSVYTHAFAYRFVYVQVHVRPEANLRCHYRSHLSRGLINYIYLWPPVTSITTIYVWLCVCIIFILCMSVLPACMSVYYMLIWILQSPKKALGSVELELQIVVSCPVGSENKNQVLWKSRQCP